METSNEGLVNQIRQYLSSLQRSERIVMVAWIIASIGLLIICFILNIFTPSTFALHSPAVGLILIALFIPVLLVAFPRKEEDDGTQLDLSYKTLVFFVIIHLYSTSLLFPNFAINPGGFLGAFIFPLLILVFVYKVPLKKLGFTGGNSRNIMGSLIISVIYGVLVFIVMGFNELLAAASWLSNEGYNVAEALGALPQAALYSILVLTIIVSIPEEFLYRSVIQTRLTERLGTVQGILLTSLLFGMCHILPNLFIFLIIIGSSFELALFQAIAISFLFQAQIGILFGIAWARTKSLVLPICLHTAHNVAELLPFFLFLMLGVTM